MATPDVLKLKIFISYSRDDLAFADQLFAGLEVAGFAPTLDRVGISGAADWRETLRAMIVNADTVVFALSPSSAKSSMCAEEVGIADSLSKRIIPVVCQALMDAQVPRRLQDLNYIFFYSEPKAPGSGFGDGLRKLKVALETDQDWMREHTRFTDRAVEWESGGRKPERLLQGTDIADAKRWASNKPLYAPDPTVLQLAFIDTSAAVEARRAANEHDAEIARINTEREAERLRLDTARIEAERAAALAESRRRRSQLLISLPAVLLATGGGAGWYIQKQRAESAEQQATIARQQTERAKLDQDLAKERADKNEIQARLLKYEQETQQNIRTARADTRQTGRSVTQEAAIAADAPVATTRPADPGDVKAAVAGVTPEQIDKLVSKVAIEMIVAFEVGGRKEYERLYQHPAWPGGIGGITIGIGYDLGYHSTEQFTKDWKQLIPAGDFERLALSVGIIGESARARIAELKDISIPFDRAMINLRDVILPKYATLMESIFPHARELPPDSYGALVSLVYNRGAMLTGNKHLEMRNIHDLMENRQFEAVSEQIRQMKRLWQAPMSGLLRRRDAEATLFEQGLIKRATELASAKLAIGK